MIAEATQAPPVAVLSRELQQLWFSLAQKEWSSLLLVPARGVHSALPIANSLVQIARRSTPEWRCALIDCTHVSLDGVADLADAVTRKASAHERVLVVVDGIDENPAALAIANCCDAAVLCVALDGSDLGSSRKTLERCGRARFIGSVVVLPNRRR